MVDIQELLTYKDETYASFHAKLVPTIDASTIIGIRVPVLRKYASMHTDIGNFLDQLPHTYYEENMLHGIYISKIKDLSLCLEKINQFLPYVDNWAVCDSMNPVGFGNKKEDFFKIQEWISSKHVYTIRFGILMLMKHYCQKEYYSLVYSIQSEEYYVNMMIAWYFCTALLKDFDNAKKVLEDSVLSIWIHNKTIQKARESRLLSQSQKDYIKTLKRKEK
ncbi:DNA alkylation repair protein [Floccifex sp.]|uniref:DNA alkylation repair protein n=1 Tax=Floccifex sp. TaxID=2815810 RepID=UPI003F054147